MDPSLPPVTFTRNLLEPDESRRALARSADTGSTIRLARGAYVDAARYETLTARLRYVTRIRAVAETRKFRPVLSHWSAAAIYDLPILGTWPDAVHVTIGSVAGGRSRNGIVKHALTLRDSDVVEIDGLLITSIERTVVDLASVLPFMGAIMVADRALLVDRFGRSAPLTSKNALVEQWESMHPFRAFARSREVIEFATDRSESPLESVSRVTMRTIRCPVPLLQVSQHDGDGYIGDTDYAWPVYNAVGEADGRSKYLDPKLRKGRTAEQVVVDEKLREDRIRAIPRAFTRWPWEIGINPARLSARLASIGVPSGIPR